MEIFGHVYPHKYFYTGIFDKNYFYYLDTLSAKNCRQKLEQQVRQAELYACLVLK